MNTTMTKSYPTQAIGDLLREWRQRRRMSQLDLAVEADISTRHLSFVETGRAQPSREMLLHLAESLEIPLRERNVLLTAAGYAPVFAERPLDDPALAAARQAVEMVLKGHEPFPALAIDRHWALITHNQAAARLMGSIAPDLLEPPVNVLRLTLHPDGLAPRIVNLAEWRAHLLTRLRHQIDLSADPVLIDLLQELSAYPVSRSPVNRSRTSRIIIDHSHTEMVVPFQLETEVGLLTFFSTTMVFGTPVDITLSELAIESFFPANRETGEKLRELAAG
jgi:transcriptional regulator with XRE-family HTH domain